MLKASLRYLPQWGMSHFASVGAVAHTPEPSEYPRFSESIVADAMA